MSKILIHNAHINGPAEEWNPGYLLIDGSTIALMGPGEAPDFPAGTVDRMIDAQGWTLLPGFIDLHVHGGIGKEVMDGTVEAVRDLARFYAQHGVTSFLPTTWTASQADIQKALNAVGEAMGPVEGGATVLGAHLEGPFLNATRTGAQDPNLIRRATPDEALPYLDTGLARLITIAPEFPENLWLADECKRRGIAVSAGHTTATFAQMETAIAHGVHHVTHCFNAMTGLGHREPGTVGAALYFPSIHAELIADNIHVHPAVQKMMMDLKTPKGLILVTDAIRGAGLPDGDYQLDDRMVSIRGGAVRLADGTLAGSTLTMERALKNVLASSGRPLMEIWPVSSLNAAREIGVSNRKGSLEVGKDADLVLLDEEFCVRATIAEGRIVYQK